VNQNFALAPKGASTRPNWASASKSAVTGLSGTYGVYADATRAAAKEVGVPYAQVMQAVTWAVKRNVLGETSDKANALIEKAWTRYHDVTDQTDRRYMTQEQTQQLIWKIATRDVARQEATRKENLAWDLARPARVAAQAAKKAQATADKAARATARVEKKAKSDSDKAARVAAREAKKAKTLL
jgi:hypothetical protein